MKEADLTTWQGILVYLECYEGRIQKVGLELLGEALRLAAVRKQPVYAVAAGRHMDAVAQALHGYPLKEVYLYEGEDEYTPMAYEKAVEECIRQLRPEIVLIGGTYEGRTLAPSLAVEFGTGLTADCTELSIDERGNLVQTRPAFGGNIMASIVTAHSRPQFATVRPGVMEAPERIDGYTQTHYTHRELSCEDGRFRITNILPLEEQEKITEQKVLIVAGRGVRKKEDLAMLRELADLLGGRLASSRALVEKGWTSPAQQIGLSGNTVSPDYMITCGVSGTVQFMAGMKHTKNIIAINTDPNAGIFAIAHYPICGDLYEIVPELIRKIKKG
jgi:electron transfer flavoprotein alpha subunit